MAPSTAQRFVPFIPRVMLSWPADQRWVAVDGSMVMVDISGFTAMSERLAKKGKVGAEEVTRVLNRTFTELLTICDHLGGDLLKFGGDALLVLFGDEGHELRAARAAAQMRTALRSVGNVSTPAGKVKLRMSVGVHSGTFQLMAAGESHRELVVAGPDVTTVVQLQDDASADEILLSRATAEHIPASYLGETKGAGVLLSRTPAASGAAVPPRPPAAAADPAMFIPAGLRPMLEFSEYESEHRLATIGFIHWEESDDLLVASGRDALCVALDELVRLAQDRAQRYELTFLATDVDTNGGKLILAAGVPTSTPTDEDHMLRAVLDISRSYTSLPVRIGVNRGPLFAGDVGAPFRRVYTVIGDAVNLAARVMAKAGSGEVLATHDVLDRSETSFDTEALEPFQVKGKSQPVAAWRIKGIAGRRKRTQEDLPMVGRTEELASITAGVSDGSATLVDITGPAGIGKSRLARELRDRMPNVAWHFADCDQYETATPYYPFRRLLREALGLAPDATASDLTSLVVEKAATLRPWVPLIGVALDIEVPETPEVSRLDAKFRTPRLRESVAKLVASLGGDRMGFLIEDAQYLDEASHGLIEHLAADLTDRLCFVLARRPTDMELTGPNVLEVELPSLERDDATRLVNLVRGDRPLLEHQLRAIVDRAAGNPLFLIELASATEGGELPDSLENLLLSRIDRLQPDLRRLLRYASVIGVSFDADLAAAAFGDLVPAVKERRTWGQLAEFVVLRKSGELRFKQALFREVAYTGLPFATRRELHERVAETLIGRDAEPGRIALHAMQAGRFDDAWSYSITAGDEAFDKHANVEAVESYRRAMAAAKRMGRKDRSAAEVGEKLGIAAERAGLLGDADTAYREARRIVDEAGLDLPFAGRLMRKQGSLREKQGEYPQALRWFSRGLRRLAEESDDTTERAELMLAYAGVRYRQAKYSDTIAWSERALELLDQDANTAELAHAYSLLGLAHSSQGHTEAHDFFERALGIYEATKDLMGQADILNNLGINAYYRGLWDRASEYWERCRKVRQAAGDVVGAAMVENNVGVVRSDQGRLDEAFDLFTDVRRVLQAAGFALGHQVAKSNLGRVHSRAGRFDEATRLLTEAATALDNIGAKQFVIEAETRLAECELFAGRATQAANDARKLLGELAGESNANDAIATLNWIAGHAERLQGRVEAAIDHFEDGFHAANAAHARFEGALNLLGLSACDVGIDDEAGQDPHATMRHLGVVNLPPVPAPTGSL